MIALAATASSSVIRFSLMPFSSMANHMGEQCWRPSRFSSPGPTSPSAARTLERSVPSKELVEETLPASKSRLPAALDARDARSFERLKRSAAPLFGPSPPPS